MKNLKFWVKGFFKIEGIVPTLLERLSWLLVCWGEWDIGLVARGRSATRAVPALVKGRPTWRVRSSPSLLGSYLPRPLSLLCKPEKVQGDSQRQKNLMTKTPFCTRLLKYSEQIGSKAKSLRTKYGTETKWSWKNCHVMKLVWPRFFFQMSTTGH